MRFQILTLGAVAAVATAAVTSKLPKPDKDGRYTISAPGIRAKVCSTLILYGSIQWLFLFLVPRIKTRS